MPDETSSRDVQRVLQALREKQSLTQRDLAERLGCSQTAVWKQEHGEVRLTVSAFFATCNALGVKPSSVLRRLGL